MGWLKLGSRNPAPNLVDLKATTQDIETLSIDPEKPNQLPQAPLSIPDHELPFIHPDEISRRTAAALGGLFIVVDEIVYDCTQFVPEHPGGEQIIKSFAGGECSWQFWRFHGLKEMEEFGRPLRVGRTKGLQNKFNEPVKYVGLKRLGDDD